MISTSSILLFVHLLGMNGPARPHEDHCDGGRGQQTAQAHVFHVNSPTNRRLKPPPVCKQAILAQTVSERLFAPPQSQRIQYCGFLAPQMWFRPGQAPTRILLDSASMFCEPARSWNWKHAWERLDGRFTIVALATKGYGYGLDHARSGRNLRRPGNQRLPAGGILSWLSDAAQRLKTVPIFGA